MSKEYHTTLFFPLLMMHDSLPPRRRWLVPVAALLSLVAGVCAPAATTLIAQSSSKAKHPLATVQVPGVPHQPDLVTVVPFYTKADETDQEKTKVVINADIDGVRGVFIVDLGAPRFNINRTFLQPSKSGGVDSVTDANRIAESGGEDSAHVVLRIGTLIDSFIEPTMPASDPHHNNAFMNHMWGNFGWNFAPRLGNIGLSVLEPFETIVDYTHKRLILIRLDKAGHRLAEVPAYTPKRTVPMIDVPMNGRMWWGVKVQQNLTLDTLDASKNTELHAMDTGAPTDGDLLGYPFLSNFGVIGFNHRTHEVIFYK